MSRDFEDQNRTAPVESEYKTSLKTDFEPVAIEKSKTNTVQKVILVLMAILVIVIICLLVYIFTHLESSEPVNDTTQEISNNEIKEEPTILDLKVDGSFSIDLYNKISNIDIGLLMWYIFFISKN